MVDATQAHADHQHQRHGEQAGQVAAVPIGSERHQEAAGALDDHRLGACRELPVTIRDVRQIDFDSSLFRRDMRRDRGVEEIGIHQVALRCQIAGCDQGIDVVAAGRHRLHADRHPAAFAALVQQGRGDQGLAHAGIGAGDE